MRVAHADDPSRHAVDGSVEIIQADVHAILVVVDHDLVHDGLLIVVQRDHMVAVPAHAAETCSRIFGINCKMALILSEIFSVGWKWPASSVYRMPRVMA